MKYLKKNFKELLIALALLVIFVINHSGFLRYLADWHVISNISLFLLLQNILLTPLIFVLYLLAFLGYGKLILPFILNEEIPSEYNILFSIAFGMGFLNLFFMFLGLIGMLYSYLVILTICVGTIPAFFILKKDFERKFPVLKFPSKTFERVILMVVVLALVYNIIAALSPPVFWDSLAYHLPVSKFYAEAHRLYLIPWMVGHQCFIGMEMLSASALTFSGDSLPQLFSFLSEVMLISAVYIFSKKHLSNNAAWISMALVSIFPVTLKLGGVVSNDFAAALYSFLAIICLWEGFESGKTSWIKLAAVFSGLSVGAKMTGVITVTWISIALVVFIVTGRIKLSPKVFFLSVLIFFSLSSATLVRNYVLTENPLYPFLVKYIGGSGIDQQILDKTKVNNIKTIGVSVTPLNFISLPYQLVANSIRFQDQPQYFIIPALLIFIIRLLKIRKYTLLEIFFLSFIVYYTFIWFVFGRHLWRFLLPAMCVGGMLAAWWWDDLPRSGIRFLTGLVIAVNLIPLISKNVNNNLFAVLSLPSIQFPGTFPRERFLEKSFAPFNLYRYVNKNIEKEAKILLFREIRGYYLEREYIWGDPINQSVIMYENFEDIAGFKKHLNSLKISHIIVNSMIYPLDESYYNIKTMNLVYSFISENCSEIYSSNGLSLYKINS